MQSEVQDQKGILEQYETRFVQVKRHIEEINSAHANQLQQLTSSNEELAKQVQKQEDTIACHEEDKQAMAQKLRDLQWAKDQGEKAQQQQIQRLLQEREDLKLNSVQDIEKIKDQVSSRFKDELAHKNSELAKLEHMYTERIDIL